MSNNPYELRASLLGQAQGILDHAYHCRVDELKYMIENGLLDVKTVTWPVPPNTTEVLAEAERLYGFVQKK